MEKVVAHCKKWRSSSKYARNKLKCSSFIIFYCQYFVSLFDDCQNIFEEFVSIAGNIISFNSEFDVEMLLLEVLLYIKKFVYVEKMVYNVKVCLKSFHETKM